MLGERLVTFPLGQCFVWDGQLVFMTERYQYASCALMIKNGNHLTASPMSSTRMHPTIPVHTMLCHEDCTASYEANLSRERFVLFSRTYSPPYSQLDTRQSSL
jgi:hypothetical protein